MHYVYQYNERGDLCRKEQYNGEDQIIGYTVYSYGEAMRTIIEEEYSRKGVLSQATITLYDPAGNPVQMIVDDGENVTTTTYTYQMVQVPWDFFAPQPDELPNMEMFVIPQSMEFSEPPSAEPVVPVFNTENIVRVTFYTFYGQGKGSDVPAENMTEIINWLNSFTVGVKGPDVLPPGIGTYQVEIEYADGSVIKRSLDTITINGVTYYLESDPQPDILEEIFSKASL